jgi:ATP-dependent RNA helicase RhlE
VHLIDANRKRELLSHLVKKNDWETGARVLQDQARRQSPRFATAEGPHQRRRHHGNKSQNARIKALDDFKTAR